MALRLALYSNSNLWKYRFINYISVRIQPLRIIPLHYHPPEFNKNEYHLIDNLLAKDNIIVTDWCDNNWKDLNKRNFYTVDFHDDDPSKYGNTILSCNYTIIKYDKRIFCNQIDMMLDEIRKQN